jgi:hypothetical protein
MQDSNDDVEGIRTEVAMKQFWQHANAEMLAGATASFSDGAAAPHLSDITKAFKYIHLFTITFC